MEKPSGEDRERIENLVKKLASDREVIQQYPGLAEILGIVARELADQLPQPAPAVFDQQGQTVTTQINIASEPSTSPSPTQTKVSTVRHSYLTYVRNRSEKIFLRGLGPNPKVSGPESSPEQSSLRLSEVYVDLKTTSMLETQTTTYGDWAPELSDFKTAESELKSVTALEAVTATRRVVLLGLPGSGKTTFLKHLAFCIASAQIDAPSNCRGRLAGWAASDWTLTPVFVSLRDFDRWLKRRASSGGNARLFWDYMQDYLKSIGLEEYLPELKNTVQGGQALVLLDGLDEVDSPKRRAVRDLVLDLSRTCDSRIVITCRTLAYADTRWQLSGFLSFELAAFGKPQIETFLELWHNELIHLRVVQEKPARALQSRLRSSLENPELLELASNPLLLTTMALVHTHDGYLPAVRAELYEACADLLLWRWDALKSAEMPSQVEQDTGIHLMLQNAHVRDIDFKMVFWDLAYRLHQGNLSDIARNDLVATFHDMHPQKDWNWADKLTSTIEARAGLIIEHVPGRFSFPHRTFQEFLAASYLAAQPDFSKIAAELALDPRWHEVILLATGRLVNISGETAKPLQLVAEMSERDLVANPDYGLCAAEILCEIGIHRANDWKIGQKLISELRAQLIHYLDDSLVGTNQRPRLGRALSRLGDPRFDERNLCLPAVFRGSREEFFGFVFVPPGYFTIGAVQNQASVYVPAYYISRYPVTESQYSRFVKDTHYAGPDHWQRDTPLAHMRNCPVVNVSWNDALAYCRWLSRRLGSLELDEGERRIWQLAQKQVLIPSEAEWEKACRGDQDTRRYPWGDEYNLDQANTKEHYVGEPLAVGIFAKDLSPYNVSDLGGNVREWTTTRYWDENKRKYALPYDANDGRENLDRDDRVTRVIKGGSYYSEHLSCECSYRMRNFPVDHHPYLGFRIVLHCNCMTSASTRSNLQCQYADVCWSHRKQ